MAKADSGHIVDLESQYEMVRLNTYLSKDLNHRGADGLGTKTDQAQETLRV